MERIIRVTEKPAALFIRVLLDCKRFLQALVPATKLHVLTFQKTVTLLLVATRNLVLVKMFFFSTNTCSCISEPLLVDTPEGNRMKYHVHSFNDEFIFCFKLRVI
jgi:hypothetical protein